ncbi:hypothetical protein [Streptomyces sp. HNM0574]|uniref:hypothetical protein n=1 Tax=Streptomyces sp. HNM0574 TaxID=2714954 RepID=UPI00146B10A7|nr:hypothetical protein [Streptomyces sp. HNM0574]NLU68842.1 hypothetical protein [Streptomyces sp. HNM0574]
MTRTEPAPDSTSAAPPPPLTRPVRAVYALAGLVMGVMWIRGGDEPAWEHALRVLVLVLVAPPVVHLVRRLRQRRRGEAPSGRQLPVARLTVAKVLLVGAGLGCDWLLGHWLAEPSRATAVGLCALIAAGGPKLHIRAANSRRTAGR